VEEAMTQWISPSSVGVQLLGVLIEQLHVQPRSSAVNVTLPVAFAAERRRLLHDARGVSAHAHHAAIDRYLLPAVSK